MMKKWLKTKTKSSSQEQLEQEALRRKTTWPFEELKKRCARVRVGLRELNEVHNKNIQEFAPKTHDCRQKNLSYDYFTDNNVLTAYIVNYMRHL